MTSDGTDRDVPPPERDRKVIPFRRRTVDPMPPTETSDQEMIERGRRIGGAAGAAMAGIMVALRDIYDSPKRDDGAVVVDSPSEPHDAHRDGMQFGPDDVGGQSDVEIAALERRDPVIGARRRSWSRRPRR